MSWAEMKGNKEFILSLQDVVSAKFPNLKKYGDVFQ